MNRLKKYLNHKNIAVVGNASSIMNNEHDIDKHDVIIRMNEGVPNPQNYRYIGKRTDILALSIEVDKFLIEFGYKPKYILWCTPINRKRLSEYLKDNCIFYPIESWNKLQEIIDGRPSTGAMVLDFINTYIDFNELHLYGFDFMKTPNWYTGVQHYATHNYAQEKIFVAKLLEKEKDVYYHE